MAGTLTVRLVTGAALLAVLGRPGAAAAQGSAVEGSGASPAALHTTGATAAQAAGNEHASTGDDAVTERQLYQREVTKRRPYQRQVTKRRPCQRQVTKRRQY